MVRKDTNCCTVFVQYEYLTVASSAGKAADLPAVILNHSLQYLFKGGGQDHRPPTTDRLSPNRVLAGSCQVVGDANHDEKVRVHHTV
jgi:hypothetical protein